MLALVWANRIARQVRRSVTLRYRSRRRSSPAPARVERLEPRSLLSGLVIQFDFSLDTNNFFNTQAKRDLMTQAAQVFTDRISDDLKEIKPNINIGNTWEAIVTNPATAGQDSIANLLIATDTIRVYVGGRDLAGDTLAEGGPGGFNVSGAQDWIDLVTARGQPGALLPPSQKTDMGPWGGSITFDTVGTDWFFGSTTVGLGATQTDFLTVATHELGHVLGFGTSDAFDAKVSGEQSKVFNGIKTVARFGGPVPLDTDIAHWGPSVTDGGLEPLMNAIVHDGTRKTLAELDFKALDDFGWTNSSGNVRMFRTYAPSVDYHFFTTSTSEFNSVVAGGGYLDETTNRQGFAVPDTKVGGAVGIHRMYNPNNGRHYYTYADNERDFLVTEGWRYEKDEGNIYTTQVTNSTEIFRLYNRNSGVHLYTENAATKDAILAQFPGIWELHFRLGFAFVAPPASSFPNVPEPERMASGSGSSASATAAARRPASAIPDDAVLVTFVQDVRPDGSPMMTETPRHPFAFTVTVAPRDQHEHRHLADGVDQTGDDSHFQATVTTSGRATAAGIRSLPGESNDETADLTAPLVDDVWSQLGAGRELGVFCEA